MASTSSASTAYNTVKSTLSTAESTVEKGLSLLSNKYVNNLLLVLFVAYLPYAAPSLGKSMVGILNNYAVKFIYIFLIAYILSKNLSNKSSVKVATVTALVIVLGILILKNMDSSEYLDNVSNQESEQPKNTGFFEKLLNISNTTLKQKDSLTSALGKSKQGPGLILRQIRKYTQEQESKPSVEVAKAVAKAQAVAVAQAQAHADAMEEIKAVSQPSPEITKLSQIQQIPQIQQIQQIPQIQSQQVNVSDEGTCVSRSPSDVTGFDENNSEYSEVQFSNDNLGNC